MPKFHTATPDLVRRVAHAIAVTPRDRLQEALLNEFLDFMAQHLTTAFLRADHEDCDTVLRKLCESLGLKAAPKS